jgi:hypothetical protein
MLLYCTVYRYVMSCHTVQDFLKHKEEENKVQYSTLDLVDGLGKTTNVLAGDAGNGDTAVLGSVDGVLLISQSEITGVVQILTSLARRSICSDVRPV